MKNILIIEDNLVVRENITEILELAGYQVQAAENGIAGVKLAQQILPDLILCDVMMPRLDGFGVLKILSSKPNTASIPFVFLTAKSDIIDYRIGMNLGADDYLTKPFERRELLNIIDRKLEKRATFQKALSANPLGEKTLHDEYLGIQELRKLANSKQHQRLRSGEYLFEEGAPTKGIWYILRGKVVCFRRTTFDKRMVLGIHIEGDCLGAQEVLKCDPHHCNAQALEDVELSFIPQQEFLDLLYGHPDFRYAFIKLLANKVAKREEQLLDMAYHSIRKRVTNALLELEMKYQSNNGVIDLLRENLAGMVGTAKESISRVLTEMKKEGLIEVDNKGRIRLTNLRELVNVSS